ncbi:unnamed protein product [Oppiella nova]|uniref:Uncharacterized protein n=1 Tax=Oppiella nova TaxID=334625 RepID=A0A7R9LGU1_9ACAR|nr:unnamed protein product [Oppiella nova]CAG2163544.1 unnamed protein product [Oppiella nova]
MSNPRAQHRRHHQNQDNTSRQTYRNSSFNDRRDNRDNRPERTVFRSATDGRDVRRQFNDSAGGQRQPPKDMREAPGGVATKADTNHMPGIPVSKNQSTIPFGGDTKQEAISGSNASNVTKPEVTVTTAPEVANGAAVDTVTDGMKRMDLKAPEDDAKDTNGVKSGDEPSPQPIGVTPDKTYSKALTAALESTVDTALPETRIRRSYTVSGAGMGAKYPGQHRYTNQRNGNNNTGNDSVRQNHINANKFYNSNDRYNANAKNESMDYKRPLKPQHHKLSPQKSYKNPMIYECTPNVSLIQPYAVNPYVNPEYIPIQRYQYYTIPVPYANPLPPNPSPNLNGGHQSSSANTGLNGGPNSAGSKGSDAGNSSIDKNQMSFFQPFQPTPEHPVPPTYYGYIAPIVHENGAYAYYFVSIFPPNITPLRVDVDPNGCPVIPSNCMLMNAVDYSNAMLNAN